MNQLEIKKIIFNGENLNILDEIKALEEHADRLKFIWRMEHKKNSELLRKLSSYEKACCAVWLTYRDLAITAGLSRVVFQSVEDKLGVGLMHFDFMIRADTAKKNLFDSIFRTVDQMTGKYYYVGYGFNIFMTDIEEEDYLDTLSRELDEKLEFYDDDDENIDDWIGNA